MGSFKIENLSFTYPGNTKKAINDISTTISKGDFVCICGKSGCGKTTLLRLLKPVLSPHGKICGKIYFDEKDICDLSATEQASKIGFVLQNPENQIVTDKVWHELAFGLENLGYTQTQIKTKIAEMTTFFGLDGLFHQKTSLLSGGQKQILSLASIMVMDPECLILDEPTSQLDPIAAQEFLKTLEKINREIGTTVIISEHRLEDVFAMANKVIVMEEGKIITDDTPRNTVKTLKENNCDMFDAMPAPVKIHSCVKNSLPCPLTVKEGREWLEKILENKKLLPVTKEASTGAVCDTAFELKDIYHKYEKNSPDVLKGLSFKGNKGEFIAVMGGNGAGKSTLLSVMAGHIKPYRGKSFVKNNTAILPQNPEVLFSEKTVYLDLLDSAQGNNDEKNINIHKVCDICRLDGLLNSHPFDLSGGEKQRAALAKVLLNAPEVFLLDEPTKGMDSVFKKEFAQIITKLKESGICIVMVSHDIEFCARYADRCALMFDGEITSEDAPREFFAGKSFYTTSTNRMARHRIPDAILHDDVVCATGGKLPEEKPKINTGLRFDEEKFPLSPAVAKKINPVKILSGIICALTFLCILFYEKKVRLSQYANSLLHIAGILCLFFSVVSFSSPKNIGINLPNRKTKLEKRLIVAIISAVFTIPLTIYLGIYIFDDRKYYFISMLVMFQTFIPFEIIFEKRKPKARELVVISVMCAIAVAGRCAFFMLPQFKPVMAIVIISAVCLGAETGFLIGAVSAFVSNFFFGQGPWTPWQMFAFGVSGLFCGILFQKNLMKKTKLSLTIVSFFTTLVIYGGIMNPASVIMYQKEPSFKMIIASYVMGLPVDLVHAVSTGFFMWILSEPMIEKLERIKVKYGLNE